MGLRRALPEHPTPGALERVGPVGRRKVDENELQVVGRQVTDQDVRLVRGAPQNRDCRRIVFTVVSAVAGHLHRWLVGQRTTVGLARELEHGEAK